METSEENVKKENIKNSPNKKHLIIIIGGVLAFLCLCLVVAGAILVPPTLRAFNKNMDTSTLADDQLKSDVLASISEFTGCSSTTLYSASVMTRPEQSADGSWTETWLTNGCGSVGMYSITFTPDGAGGTHYSVSAAGQ